MSREIKFRIYGKENGIMYDWDEILNFDSLTDSLKNGSVDDQYYSPLMQYTGLKDKKGKEIYEGDIIHSLSPFYSGTGTIHDYDDDIYKVIWKNTGFWLENKDGLYADFDELIEPSVIGNTYENPALLAGER